MQIDWWTFIAQIINLVILLFLLRKFLYKPVLKVVEARQKTIADELNQAATERQKAARLTKEFERKTEQIERQKQEVLAAAHKEAEELTNQLTAQAHAEYQHERQSWQQKLRKEQKTFDLAVQNSVAENFTLFAEQALQQMADTNLNTMIVNCFKKKIQNMSEPEKTALHEALKSTAKIEIQTAQSLSSKECQDVQDLLIKELSLPSNTAFGVVIHPELICGIAIQAGEKLVSWNLSGYLQDFKQQTDAQMQQLLKKGA